MERSFSTSIKATVFAAILMWSLIMHIEFSVEMLPFILLSIIPIWLVCFFSILITIAPFYYFNKNRLTNHNIFKKYFPYYSVFSFIGCIAMCIISEFYDFVISFFTIAFFTAILSWIWFFKVEETIEIITPKLLENDTKS